MKGKITYDIFMVSRDWPKSGGFPEGGRGRINRDILYERIHAWIRGVLEGNSRESIVKLVKSHQETETPEVD